MTKNQRNIAVQVLPHRADLSYYDHEKILTLLDGLKVKRVRGFVGPNMSTRTLDFYRAAYERYNIKSWLTVGEPRVTLNLSQWDDVQETIDNRLSGTVAMVAGWNEPNHNRNGSGAPLDGWKEKTGQHQAELFDRFGTELVIGSMQLWSGNLSQHDADLRALAPYVMRDGKPLFEKICWHLYQPGFVPFNRYRTIYTSLFGNLPVVCTETGVSTAPNQTSGAISVDEVRQAQHLQEAVGMYRDAGYGINWFELMDEHDPSGTDREDWLGIVRADGTPKPAYYALRKMLRTA